MISAGCQGANFHNCLELLYKLFFIGPQSGSKRCKKLGNFRYITHKVHIYDRQTAKRLIVKEVIEDPLNDFID